MDAQLDVACHLNVLLPDVSSSRLPYALESIAAAGYRRVVLPPLDPASVDASALADVIAASGLSPITIAGQAPQADVSSPDPEVREAGLLALRSALELTIALGADQMNGVPYGVFGHPTRPTDADAFRRAAESVGRIADEASASGVLVTFEVLNRYETSLVNTAAQAMEFVEASGSPHLRIHLDTFHMMIEESDVSAAIRAALPKIGYLELGQSSRGRLSSGALDVARIVRQAIDDGYAGRWGVEAFSRSTLAPEVADMLAIWRRPFDAGAVVALDAARTIDTGWAASAAQRA